MVVEFTGCSGAGKTSLARRVRELLRERTIWAIDPLRLMLGSRLDSLLPARPLSTHMENAVVELLGLPSTMLARRRYAAADRLVRSWIGSVCVSRAEWLRLSRSWRRKLAVLASVNRCPSPVPILLFDEGTVHFAMTLLARRSTHAPNALERYLHCVPLPTCVVRVDAAPGRRIARLAQRWTKPAPDRDPAERAAFLDRFQYSMERLTAHPHIAGRIVQVANDQQSLVALDHAARQVADRIMAWQAESESGATNLVAPAGSGERLW